MFVLLLQQHSPPLCPFALLMLTQNVPPQLCLPWILQ